MTRLAATSLLLALLCGPRLAAQDRAPARAGQFYPANMKELGQAIAGYLARAPEPAKLPGPLVALIVPHAGYEFSAPVAAAGYRHLAATYDTVVIFAAAHTMPVAGSALYARGAFSTPLGRVPIDETLAARLLKDQALFQDEPRAHLQEHSVEVQLPFLIQSLKPGWKLLPLVLNTENPQVALRVGQAVASAAKGRKVLFLASSDLSHYPPSDVAARVDRATLKALERLDPEYFWLANRVMLARREPGLETAWCGEAAVIAAMAAAKEFGADRAVLLRYANSGDSPRGEAGRAVGYAAAAMVRSGQPPASAILLDTRQKQALLKLARDTVALGTKSERPQTALDDDPVLNLPAAVFVTLTKGGQLRGCIGTTEARATLRDAVASSAYSAGFEDHRFAPVAREELSRLHIEISMLSAARPVAGPQAVIPKTHGVILSQGGQAGLFLPQVWEQLPDKADFLSELCSQKAGLPRDCWKDPKTRISVFTVNAFEEKKNP
ncbi:MAG TPA: hypothetical protein DEB40_04730 [Elusimicrobia bacterium]|nr:hypothetical protein [Elusimicrobiota bacterium]HBT61028.1 hypothetical protein [Elusimicrobiota bacterium]